MSTDEQEAVIIGAGIAELAAALAPKRVGIKSVVLERSPELRAAGAAPSLSPDTWRALDALGIGDKLSAACRLAKRGDIGVRGLHLKEVPEALAEEPRPDTIRFSSKLASIKTETIKDLSTVTLLELEDGALIRAKAAIGCDGVHSADPQWLGLTTSSDLAQATVRLQKFVGKEKKDRVPALNDTDVSWSTTQNTPEENERAMGHVESIQTTDRSTVSLASVKYHARWQSGKNSIGSHKGPVVHSRDALLPMASNLAQRDGTALEGAVVLPANLTAAPNAEKGPSKYAKKRSWAASLNFGAYLSGWVREGPRAGRLGRAGKWFRGHAVFRCGV